MRSPPTNHHRRIGANLEVCARSLPVLARLIRDPSPKVRELALSLMGPIPDAANGKALADAMAAAPRLYVGHRVGDDPKRTLFSKWLSALGANYPYNWPDARRAIKLADPYLDLPEAGEQGQELTLTLLQQEMVDALPGLLEGASDDKIEKFVDYLEPGRLEAVGMAMRKARPETLARFARTAHRALTRRFPTIADQFWTELAAALGVDPDQY